MHELTRDHFFIMNDESLDPRLFGSCHISSSIDTLIKGFGSFGGLYRFRSKLLAKTEIDEMAMATPATHGGIT